MHKNLLLALLTLSTPGLRGNKSTARVHPAADVETAADVKASQAAVTATETDAKVTHDDALPYFEQWVRNQPRCSDECPFVKHNASKYCPQHCNESCIDELRNNQPCPRLRHLTYDSFETNNHCAGPSAYSCNSIALTNYPKQIARQICAALPTLPQELAMVIANYTPERIIFFTVQIDALIRKDGGSSLHSTDVTTIQCACSCNCITQDRYFYSYKTIHTCCYNVDTNQSATLSTLYQRTTYRVGRIIEVESSDTPDFSNNSEPKKGCTVQ
jgi:hypothetical protein